MSRTSPLTLSPTVFPPRPEFRREFLVPEFILSPLGRMNTFATAGLTSVFADE